MKLVNSNLSPLMAFGNLCPALNFYCFDLCSVLPMESTKGKGMYNGESTTVDMLSFFAKSPLVGRADRCPVTS